MSKASTFLEERLKERAAKDLLRKLSFNGSLIDFSSNDYLGFARNPTLHQHINEENQKLATNFNGSGGSRLLSGNHPYTEETEQFIADFHQATTGLIFNSGYDANVGLLSAIPQRGDTIITDELIHASLIDGARLSHAERYKFKHNDLNDLEQKLKIAKGLIYVAVESIYSMDGDMAPLQAISQLCQKYQANLIVDEAHATGLFGENGKGLVYQLGLCNAVFARVVTFGKAIGVHGAIVLGSETLRNYLINFARSFIYTTAMPLHNVIAIRSAYLWLIKEDHIKQIQEKIALYNLSISKLNIKHIPSESAIQTVLFPNSTQAKNVAFQLQQGGFDVRAILSPTVPVGKERLRICLHTYNTTEDITKLVQHLKELI